MSKRELIVCLIVLAVIVVLCMAIVMTITDRALHRPGIMTLSCYLIVVTFTTLCTGTLFYAGYYWTPKLIE